LFASLDSITPGEFRALLKVGAWKTAETRSEITVEGVVPQHLFYVLDGHINIEKAGRQMAIGPKTFIGEVAFLHRTPASATVSVEPGARYLQWSVAELEKIGSRRSLRNSVIRLIGMDMALKVARS
jgi:CRP-like cAMP-binding protein